MAIFRKKKGGFCPQCGNQVDFKHDHYCMKCGYALPVRKKGRKLGLIKIILIILIILAGIVAIRAYQGKPLIPDFSLLRNLSGK